MTKAWKHTEEVFAKALKLKRIVRTNWSSEEPDCFNDFFVLEAKERKQGFPKLIERAFEQVEKYTKKFNKENGKIRIPLVGLHKWASKKDYFIVVRLEDFAKIIKEE
jgi:hypothetical protein